MILKRSFLVTLISTQCVLGINAQGVDRSWHIVTNNNISVSIADVEYIMSVDNSEILTIMKKNGNLITDVKVIRFIKDETNGIDGVSSENNDVKVVVSVDSKIKLSGLTGNVNVNVYSANGMKVMSVNADESDCEIDVSNLVSGVYMLKVNNTTIKFLKK